MHYNTAIMATLFLIGFALFSTLSIKSGRIPIEKLKRMALMTGSFGIISGILSLNAVLLVIAPRVSGDLKDGIFGAAGGFLFGTCMFSVFLGAIVIGLFVGKNKMG